MTEPDSSNGIVRHEDIPEVDALPVLAEATVIEPARATPVATQAVVVAATSFVAGVATIAMVRSHPLRRLGARRRRRDVGRVLASRTFLVDVHVLGDRR